MEPTPGPVAVPPTFHLPERSTVRLFLEGALWAAVNCLPPVGVAMATYWHRGQRVDWAVVGPMLGSTIATALVAYWRKYKAMLAPRPQ